MIYANSQKTRQSKSIFAKVLCVIIVIFMMIVYLIPFSSMTAGAISIAVYNETNLQTALDTGADVTLWSNINTGTLSVNQTSSIDLNGYVLTVNNGIIIASDMTLTIKDSKYTYDNHGTGKLLVTGDTNSAGIVATNATLVIESGVIQSTGSDGSWDQYGGDGIQGGNVIINGGSITAYGGDGGNGSTNRNGYAGGNGISGTVIINDGEVKAIGGIGGEGGYIQHGAHTYGDSGNGGHGIVGVTIHGGLIEAIGGNCGESRADGEYGSNGNGIRYLYAIYGGTIKASSGNKLVPEGVIVSGGQQYTKYGYKSVDVLVANTNAIIANCTLELCLAGCGYSSVNGVFYNCTVLGEGAIQTNYSIWGTYDSEGQLIAGTVTFDSMGGEDIESKTVAIGLTISKPKDIYKSYHTFDGWYTAENGGEKVQFPYTVTKDVTLYARWIPYTYTIKYALTYNSIVPSQTFGYGDVIEEPVTPVRTGYNFEGWYDAQTGGGKVEFPYTVTEDATFYARWSEKVYTITFDTNGGPTVSNQNVYGNTMITIPDPVWEGKQFLGWYTEKNGGTKIEFPYAVTDDVTFYARWYEEHLKGDVNLDGTFDIADVKLLQDYLVCRETLTAEQGAVADVCNDGVLNAFDLCVLRRMYLEQSKTAQ